ncbi:hypothetical protein BV22DRAFT_755923 [Leucogyrophana mollusca]|uniref:Uncharacterized protein n=1 Tax=Leucogyrophana mollusca TaxID=85980 RepID=A0ACB8B749_9AGAM|nr:hypothetical protein BV22DRAFT_755923 [Leucogyrophana mollusca]
MLGVEYTCNHVECTHRVCTYPLLKARLHLNPRSRAPCEVLGRHHRAPIAYPTELRSPTSVEPSILRSPTHLYRAPVTHSQPPESSVERPSAAEDFTETPPPSKA